MKLEQTFYYLSAIVTVIFSMIVILSIDRSSIDSVAKVMIYLLGLTLFLLGIIMMKLTAIEFAIEKLVR